MLKGHNCILVDIIVKFALTALSEGSGGYIKWSFKAKCVYLIKYL